MINIPGYTITGKIQESRKAAIYRGLSDLNNDNTAYIFSVHNKEDFSHEHIAGLMLEHEKIQGIESEGIVRPCNIIDTGNNIILVREDHKGITLKTYQNNKPIDLKTVLEIGIQLAEVLDEIHKHNIIHGNISSHSIYINEKDGRVNIGDFLDISLPINREHSIYSNDIIEKRLPYISPEQTGRMNRSVDYRTDFYSLGAVFYEMLTGRQLFQSRDPMELVHCHIAKTPPSLHELNPGIPQQVSVIVMKLLSKTAEDRYQSAYGLKADIERCIKEFIATGAVNAFKPGLHDISGRFQIPQKLYGRDKEIKALMDTFDRVSMGTKEMILVAGYSGIGKSVMVQEINKPVVKKRGYFISGKFDQLKRNIPYASLIQAFQELVRRILTESEDRIASWKTKILNAVGPNGQIVINVIPEVELIIGRQQPVPDLPNVESLNRFNLVFQNFIRAFSTAEHPLVIFLDDLQWADSSSLKLIEQFMSSPDNVYFLIIGAYRDNEVYDVHPLFLTLEKLRQVNTIINTITLQPLDISHIKSLISNTLMCGPDMSGQLAVICNQKTLGNPFYLNHFLYSLFEDKLIEFNNTAGVWQCDIDRIRQMQITDNVVEFIVGKIQKLSRGAQFILENAACIGNRFDLKTLAAINKTSLPETAKALLEVIQKKMIALTDDKYKFLQDSGEVDNASYKFVHNRIRQAAYSLIDEEHKKKTHFKIGRVMLETVYEEDLDEVLFHIVNHLNQGRELIHEQVERDNLVRLNMKAGIKAKASAAYDAAFEYLSFTLEMLGERSWEQEYESTLTLYIEAAEAAYLSNEYDEMDRLISIVMQQARTLLDKVKIYEIRIQAAMSQIKPMEAVKISLSFLKMVGIKFPEAPNKFNIVSSLLKTKFVLAGRQIENLLYLPEMKNQHMLAALRIFERVLSPAYFATPNLFPLMVFKIIRLSLKYGNAPTSALAYAAYGLVLCGELGELDAGYRFGKLAVLVEERLNAYKTKARTNFIVSNMINHWHEHLDKTVAPLKEVYQIGIETGDFEYACYGATTAVYHQYILGRNLVEVEQEMAKYRNEILKLKQESSLHALEIYQQAVNNLLGDPDDPCILSGDIYDEQKMLPHHLKSNDGTGLAIYYTNKLTLYYLFHNYSQAIKFADQGEKYLNSVLGMPDVALFNFYDSLSRLSMLRNDNSAIHKPFIKKITSNQKKMKKWARYAPMNYLHKYYLVEAELARFFDQEAKAREYYNHAIKLAKENKYPNEEALAYELYGAFWMSKGEVDIANLYIKKAHYNYQSWRARRKVRDLEERYPGLFPDIADTGDQPLRDRAAVSLTDATSISDSSLLDFTTVMKSSQAISREISLKKLMEELMNIVIENAGAQRGFLIMEHDAGLFIEAAGAIDKDEKTVPQSVLVESSRELSSGIVNYVKRTLENVVLNDAMNEGLFISDPYVREKQPKSILCIPVTTQNKLIGILYLENNLTTNAFTRERLEVLNLLSSQAAISLENARLYNNMEQRVKERTAELSKTNLHLKKEVSERIKIEEELKKAKETAESASRSKSEFLANMSHEIRTPMNAIIGMTALAMDTGITTDEQRDCLDTVDKSAHSLLTLINDILDFSKIEAGKLAVDIIDFNLRLTVENVADTLAAQAGVRGLEIVCLVHHDVPSLLLGDPSRIRQVLLNLGSNAVKFTHEGEVVVRAELKEETENKATVLFSITDTGIGITEDKLKVVFEEFAQADGSTTRAYGGSGLGLSISKKLVQLMGGEIGVESKAGRGSRFWFSLTLEKQNLQETTMEEASKDIRGIKALIVDDNRTNREILQKMLESFGCEAEVAEGGAEAIDKLKKAASKGEPFRIALMDMMMPGMDGEHTTIIIKNIPEIRDIAVIILTSLGACGDISRLREIGCSGYLIKPVKQALLLDAIAAIISGRGSEGGLSKEIVTRYSIAEKKINNIQILLAEDNPVNQKMTTMMLKKAGYLIDVAEDGRKAIEALEKKSYDLILMDIQMPEMDGLEATKEIRSREGTEKHSIIIAMTAHAMEGDRERCINAGMDDYISKPIDPQTLFDKIRQWSKSKVSLPSPEINTNIEKSERINERKMHNDGVW